MPSSSFYAHLKIFSNINSNKKVTDGPVVPRPTSNPCVAGLNRTTYFIASNQIPAENSNWLKSSRTNNSTKTLLLYDFGSDDWTDVSNGFPCNKQSAGRRLKCTNYRDSHVIVMMSGISCTAILSLSDKTWSRTEFVAENLGYGIILLERDNEATLVNGNSVYKLNNFGWKLQSRMNIFVNESAFVTESKFVTYVGEGGGVKGSSPLMW